MALVRFKTTAIFEFSAPSSLGQMINTKRSPTDVMKRSTYTPPEDSCLITGTAIDLLPHPPISVTACHCPRTRHTVQSAHLAAGLPVSAAPCEYTPCSYTRLPPPVQPSTEVTTCMQANHERTAWSVYERRQQQRRQKPPEKLDIFARVLAPTQHRRSP